jgi:hypothetical protein
LHEISAGFFRMTYLLASRDGNQLNESMMYMMAPASPLRVGTRLKQG